MKCYVVTSSDCMESSVSWLYSSIAEALGQVSDTVSLVTEDALKKLKDTAAESDLIIFLNAHLFSYTRAEAERLLRDTKAFKIQVGFDDEYMLTWTLYAAQFMDAIFTFDTVTYEYLKQLGVNVKMCIHPFPEVGRATVKEQCYDISFVGRVATSKPARYKFISKLKERFPNSFFPGFDGLYLTIDEMQDVFLKSKINLNFTGIDDYDYGLNLPFQHERRGMKGRPFEIGMLGGFCLSEYSPSLDFFLERHVHIEYFDNIDEAIEKIDFYLKNNDAREIIAADLNQKVIKDFSSRSPNNIFVKAVKDALSDPQSRFNELERKQYFNVDFERARLAYQLKSKDIYKSFVTFKDISRRGLIFSLGTVNYVLARAFLMLSRRMKTTEKTF